MINYSTSAVGDVRVAIEDADGHPIPGYTLSDAHELVGDNIQQVVCWTGGADVSPLAGTPVRLRFVMADSDLYSFRFMTPKTDSP